MSKDMKNTFTLLLGGTIGFTVFWLTSHPTRSRVRRKLPHKRVGNITYLPEIRVERKDRSYHLHHWINMGSLYIYLLTRKRRYLKNNLIHGFLLGSILQGLSYKDRFTIIRKPVTPPKDI